MTGSKVLSWISMAKWLLLAGRLGQKMGETEMSEKAGTVQEFLGLSDEESRAVESKVRQRLAAAEAYARVYGRRWCPHARDYLDSPAPGIDVKDVNTAWAALQERPWHEVLGLEEAEVEFVLHHLREKIEEIDVMLASLWPTDESYPAVSEIRQWQADHYEPLFRGQSYREHMAVRRDAYLRALLQEVQFKRCAEGRCLAGIG